MSLRSDRDYANNLVRRVSTLGAGYLNSYRGFDDTAPDGALHRTIIKTQSGDETRVACNERVYREIDFRVTQMFTADKYLQIMSIPPPKWQLCYQYDITKIREEVGDEKNYSLQRLFFDNDRRVLFPNPVEGRPFYKGLE